jgi:Bacteriophage A118-like holin, Hol118
MKRGVVLLEQVLMFSSLLAPLVTAMMELLKRTFPIPKKYIPITSFFMGLMIGLLAAPVTEMNVELRLWSGGIAGLAATGLYEIGKKSKKYKRAS